MSLEEIVNGNLARLPHHANDRNTSVVNHANELHCHQKVPLRKERKKIHHVRPVISMLVHILLVTVPTLKDVPKRKSRIIE